jgi:hypothetical protein
MKDIRKFIENIDLKTRLHDEYKFIKDEEFFRSRCLQGFDRLLNLKDKYKDKPALVMGHGPSLLEIEKEKYDSFIKITCNDFHKIPEFFDDDFKPDFWCGSNSLEALKEPFSICLQKKIACFITIPKKTEFEELFNIYDEENNLVVPWIWEHRVFQEMLAAKYNFLKIYTHCNTTTNHMIAFALWLGCNPIHITGFDMSYSKALRETGMTHAGYNSELFMGDNTVTGLAAFDDPKERKQIINDLKYLCKIAYNNNIKMHNLSFKQNKLPYSLSYRKK